MRIRNADTLTAHGNVTGRRAVVDLLETGLTAADPYHNTLDLIHIDGNRMFVGHPDFAVPGAPPEQREVQEFDLTRIRRILVLGAGKGAQRVAKALEDVLSDRLTGGHVIDKVGGRIQCERIGVTLGGHPVPTDDCVRGCEAILDWCRDPDRDGSDLGLGPDDLVFTIAANGFSSLLTLPVPGVTLDEVRHMTRILQIERGTPTGDLNAIRNHVDMLKGGRLSRYLQPAQAVHVLAIQAVPWDNLMHGNRWLHAHPESSTFAEAIAMLHKWEAWDEVAPSIRSYLSNATAADETVKPEEFLQWRSRTWGVMPESRSMLAAVQARARTLGYTPHVMGLFIQAEARELGYTMAGIAQTVEELALPFAPPCVLFSFGESIVTVGKDGGIGGRNQEFVLANALRIAGDANIVVGACDTDGTDGPGMQFHPDAPVQYDTLAGAVADGYTVAEAQTRGIDLYRALVQHNTTPALYALDSGVLAEHSISINDLRCVLVMGRGEHAIQNR